MGHPNGNDLLAIRAEIIFIGFVRWHIGDHPAPVHLGLGGGKMIQNRTSRTEMLRRTLSHKIKSY
jgi:hypothetical protein